MDKYLLAYLGLSLAQILIEKGPEAYFRIVSALQTVDPKMENIQKMIDMAKHPDSYLK